MNVIALRSLVEEIGVAEEHLQSSQRRLLRDELAQSLFQKYYRVNKPAFRYLLEILTTYTQPTKKQFGVPSIVKPKTIDL